VDEQRRQRLWRLVTARARGDEPGWGPLVCEVAVDRLDIDGAAISVRTSGRAQDLIAATGAWAQQLEELQYTLGEGPGVEAYTNAGPVLVADLFDAAPRWPGFARSAAEEGLAAVFALPLQEGAIRVGTLTLYRRRVGGLSTEELSDAAVLADLATTALLTDTAPDATPSWFSAGRAGHYDDVNVATGMIAAELRISIADASLRLRAHAFSTGTPLLEIARAVLSRQLRADSFQD
jgi:hypothetical protein